MRVRFFLNCALKTMALGIALSVAACSSPITSQLPTQTIVARPKASYNAEVKFRNSLADRWVAFEVYSSYKIQRGWTKEGAACVPPRTSWNATVEYNHPLFGPQIKFLADVKETSCSGASKGSRELQFNFAFNKDGKALWEIATAASSKGSVLCAKYFEKFQAACTSG